MDKIIKDIRFEWNSEERFRFLQFGTSFYCGNSDSYKVKVNVNTCSTLDNVFLELEKFFPRIKTGLDGRWKNYYISYFFNGEISIITNTKEGITAAKIHKSYAEEQKRLFIVNLMRNHIIRHLIYGGYLIYHASAIVKRNTNHATMVIGRNNSGKTTFALEAVKSGAYQLLAEDKVVMNPLNNVIFGGKSIHLRADRRDAYMDFLENRSLINGGVTERKYQASIRPEFYRNTGRLCQVIILNQDYDTSVSFSKKVTFNEKMKLIIEHAQKNLYIDSEKEVYNKSIKKIFDVPVYELYRSQEDTNYAVFQRDIDE